MQYIYRNYSTALVRKIIIGNPRDVSNLLLSVFVHLGEFE